MSAAARAHPRRRPVLAVDVVGVLNVVGTLVAYLSLAPLLPAAVALGYDESPWPFLAATAIAGGLGLATMLATRGDHRLGIREGFLVVSLTWLVAAAIGAMPYVFSGEPQVNDLVDAYFEGMSGFSTTGGSILTDVEALPRGLAMWRQFSQWLGGIGIIVLALAVLPRLRVGGRQLLEHELPGPEIESLSTRIRDTARRIWILYVALTAALFTILVALWATGVDDEVSPFHAIAHAFTTIPTAGFSTKANSIEAFAPATQWVIVLFMVLGGINFALMYRALVRRQPRAAARDEELRLYLALLVLGALVLVVEIWTEDVVSGWSAVREGVFTAVSTMTTTGFSVADYNTWPALALMTIVGLMFVGGSAGSTSGSVKVVRHVLLGKILRREIDQTMHPEVVRPVWLNRTRRRRAHAPRRLVVHPPLHRDLHPRRARARDRRRTHRARALDDRCGLRLREHARRTSARRSESVGRWGRSRPFSDFSKLVMIGLMWMGRLEIIPIVVLLSRHYWRSS